MAGEELRTTVAEVRALEAVVDLDRKIPKIPKVELRDLFAMVALNGLLSHATPVSDGYSGYAETSYRYADAMLEARNGE